MHTTNTFAEFKHDFSCTKVDEVAMHNVALLHTVNHII